MWLSSDYNETYSLLWWANEYIPSVRIALIKREQNDEESESYDAIRPSSLSLTAIVVVHQHHIPSSRLPLINSVYTIIFPVHCSAYTLITLAGCDNRQRCTVRLHGQMGREETDRQTDGTDTQFNMLQCVSCCSLLDNCRVSRESRKSHRSTNPCTWE